MKCPGFLINGTYRSRGGVVTTILRSSFLIPCPFHGCLYKALCRSLSNVSAPRAARREGVATLRSGPRRDAERSIAPDLKAFSSLAELQNQDDSRAAAHRDTTCGFVRENSPPFSIHSSPQLVDLSRLSCLKERFHVATNPQGPAKASIARFAGPSMLFLVAQPTSESAKSSIRYRDRLFNQMQAFLFTARRSIGEITMRRRWPLRFQIE